MEIKFKEIEWKKSLGTMETARPGFRLKLDVWDYSDVCIWSIGDAHTTFEKNRCRTREQAKAKARQAFIDYVEENISLCTEDIK